VIVELVNATTGYQTWSSHYDDSLSNIFQVQDKISAAIADALKVKFASANTQRSVNPEAYDLVQQARALLGRSLTAAPIEKARSLLEEAIALDPYYADAHAALAGVWSDLPQYSTLARKDALPKARAEARKALTLDPANVHALVTLANIDTAKGHVAKARAEYRHAIELDPSNAGAHMDYALTLPLKQSLTQTLEAVQLDPDSVIAQNNLVASYVDLGQYAQALPHAQKLQRLLPHNPGIALSLAQTYGLLHRHEDAVKAFDLATPDTVLGKAIVAAGRLTYQSLLDPKLRPQALAALDALSQRPDLDPPSTSDMIQLYAVLGEKRAVLGLLPGMCTSIPAACSDLSVNPIWLPLRGDSTFEALVKRYDTTSKPLASGSPSPSSP
jgi:tetratricopeptide (TPR) repeat protein